MRQELKNALDETPVFTWDRAGRGDTPRVYEKGRYCLAIDERTGQPYIARIIGFKTDWQGKTIIGFALQGEPNVNPFDIRIVDRFAETSKGGN